MGHDRLLFFTQASQHGAAKIYHVAMHGIEINPQIRKKLITNLLTQFNFLAHVHFDSGYCQVSFLGTHAHAGSGRASTLGHGTGLMACVQGRNHQ